MKKRIHGMLFLTLLLGLLFVCSLPVAAAGFQTVYTDSSWPTKNRTANGVVFTSTYQAGIFSLTAAKGGNIKKITSSFNGGSVLSDGKTVYFCAKKSGRFVLYKADVMTASKTKIATLSKTAYSIDLAGYYKNNVYFIIDSPEGIFAKINLKSKSIKKLVSSKRVTIAQPNGKYFILTDGTGAGYSYLGVWNAASGKFSTVTPKPYTWYITSKYLYYVEVVKGEILWSDNVTINVKRYSLAGNKRKMLVKSLKIKDITKLTSKYIKYHDVKGKLKTKRW